MVLPKSCMYNQYNHKSRKSWLWLEMCSCPVFWDFFEQNGVTVKVWSKIVMIVLLSLQFCSKHCKFVKFQFGLNSSNEDRFTWHFHSNFDLISSTNLPNFNEIYFPAIAEIQVRKSGFLQITQKTYSVRWQALSRDAFLVKDGDFKHENWFHWTYPRDPKLRARNSPGALASALIRKIISKPYFWQMKWTPYIIWRQSFAMHPNAIMILHNLGLS